MSGVYVNSGKAIYATDTALRDSINQIQEVGAIAPLIQSTNALASWNTDQVGPLTDHNLLNNNNVFLHPTTGNMTEMNSLSFKAGVVADPLAGSLWLNDSDNHLYHGAVDLEAGGGSGDVSGGAISALNEIATYNALTGKSIGRSGLNAKYDSFNIFMSSGPIPSISGGAQENTITSSAPIPSPVANSSNTFYGSSAGNSNASNFNSAFGSSALAVNVDPSGSNTAVGARALASATSAALSTAVGTEAGENMLTSTNNTLCGHRAGYSFEEANSCVMLGTFAGGFELVTPVTGGVDCIFIGKQAGYSTGILDNVNGVIAIGPLAGSNITDNTFCLYLDHSGVAGEDGVIRIGNPGIHVKNFQEGIRGVITDAADAIPVLVSSTGQLGTVSSSIKYKENVKDLSGSDIIHQLRPVEFNTKKHPNVKSIGLIAEEVEKIYPDMCVYQDGELLTVDYSRLSILLLSEVQKLKYDLFMLKNK